MNQKERRALDRCFDNFLHDLDPSPSFLHSLFAEGILTEEQIDKLSKIPSRQTRVAMLLLRYLPLRGPTAFTIFKDKLQKDYPWLTKKLEDELRKLQSGQASINKNQLKPSSNLPENESMTLKSRVDIYVHEKFGQSKRLSEEDKKEIRRFLYKQLKHANGDLSYENVL